jgi:hypothetical protein
MRGHRPLRSRCPKGGERGVREGAKKKKGKEKKAKIDVKVSTKFQICPQFRKNILRHFGTIHPTDRQTNKQT